MATFLRTWPADVFHPPLFQLNHVLAGGGVTPIGAHPGPAVGSDHLPVIATVALPPL
jgi:endonuclease/exonuclease/phosphatase (EEP) superfamily protein YafD